MGAILYNSGLLHRIGSQIYCAPSSNTHNLRTDSDSGSWSDSIKKTALQQSHYIVGSSVAMIVGVVLGVVIFIVVVLSLLVNFYFRRKAAKAATNS